MSLYKSSHENNCSFVCGSYRVPDQTAVLFTPPGIYVEQTNVADNDFSLLSPLRFPAFSWRRMSYATDSTERAFPRIHLFFIARRATTAAVGLGLSAGQITRGTIPSWRAQPVLPSWMSMNISIVLGHFERITNVLQ